MIERIAHLLQHETAGDPMRDLKWTRRVGVGARVGEGTTSSSTTIITLSGTRTSATAILVSTFIGWRRPNKVKQQPYECGITPTGDARQPFSVKFYLVAMVFILLDAEAIFLYPWAYIFKDLARNPETHGYSFLEMMFFLSVVMVGYIYLWRKGAFDWHKSQK